MMEEQGSFLASVPSKSRDPDQCKSMSRVEEQLGLGSPSRTKPSSSSNQGRLKVLPRGTQIENGFGRSNVMAGGSDE